MTKRIISLILAIMCLTTAVYADETLILNGIPVDKSYGQSADETTTVETTEGETATDVTSGTTADTTVEDTTILPTDEMLSYLNMLGEMISTIDEQYSFIYK
jgi:cbb3-type cytochrome oxidase cytochrome c subunit